MRDVVARHPRTQELCWFNHLTFFNLLTLPENTQALLKDVFKNEELPNNTYYGDGTAIPDGVLEELISAYRAEERLFDWKKNDVLLLDNMLVSHGRQAFSGEREVYVGFSETCRWDEVRVNS